MAKHTHTLTFSMNFVDNYFILFTYQRWVSPSEIPSHSRYRAGQSCTLHTKCGAIDISLFIFTISNLRSSVAKRSLQKKNTIKEYKPFSPHEILERNFFISIQAYRKSICVCVHCACDRKMKTHLEMCVCFPRKYVRVNKQSIFAFPFICCRFCCCCNEKPRLEWI